MSSANKPTYLTPNRSADKNRLSDAHPLPKNTPSGIKDYTVNQRLSTSPSAKPQTDTVEVTSEDRKLFEELVKPRLSDASRSVNKGSTFKSLTPQPEKASLTSKLIANTKPKTPTPETRDQLHERTPGDRASKSPEQKPHPSSHQGSKSKLTFSEDRTERGENSEGRKSSSRKRSGTKETPKVKEGLLRELEADGNVRIEISGHSELAAQDDSKHHSDGQQGNGNEETGTERKEYSLYEDWRIIESVENHVRFSGNKGTSSLSFWEKIIDPKTGKKLLDGARSAESLKDHHRRTILQLSPEDIETIRKFVEEHSEEQQKEYFVQYKKDGKNKKFTGIARSAHFNANNLRRKTPYNASVKEIRESHEASKPKKTKPEQIGKVEAAFYESNRRASIEDDDITNITPPQSQVPAKRIIPALHAEPERRVTSSSLGSLLNLNQYNYPTLGSNRRGTMNIESYGSDDRRRSTYQSNPYGQVQAQVQVQPQPQEMVFHEAKKRKSYETERLLFRDNGDLKKPKSMLDYESKSLIVSDAFRTRRDPPSPLRIDENLSVFVDREKKVRFAMLEQPQIDTAKEKEIKRLVQLAKEYDIQFENLVELLERASNNCDDLELCLKENNESILWTPDEDRDLLDNNKIALRYLRNLKGEERINRRRQFLLEKGY